MWGSLDGSAVTVSDEDEVPEDLDDVSNPARGDSCGFERHNVSNVWWRDVTDLGWGAVVARIVSALCCRLFQLGYSLFENPDLSLEFFDGVAVLRVGCVLAWR